MWFLKWVKCLITVVRRLQRGRFKKKPFIVCSYAWNLSVVCFKVKQPYLTSITCNSISTDKAEVDGGFISPSPPLHQCSILWVFEATQKRKKLKQGCEIRGSNLGPLAQRRWTNRLCHLCSWKMFLWENIYLEMGELEWQCFLNSAVYPHPFENDHNS